MSGIVDIGTIRPVAPAPGPDGSSASAPLTSSKVELPGSPSAVPLAAATDAIEPTSLLPARDLRAARRLLQTLRFPHYPGPRHDERS